MSGDAVETAASILTQKVDKEHRKHNSSTKQFQDQKRQSQGSRQSIKRTSSYIRRQQMVEEECSCEEVKAEIEAGKTSSVMRVTEDRSDGLLRRREAIAERNDTERILTKETVKVLTKSSNVES